MLALNSAACASAKAKAFSLVGISVAKRMVEGLLHLGLILAIGTSYTGFPGEGTWLEFKVEIGVETISAPGIPTRNLRGYGRGEPNSRCPCYGTEASALAPRADWTYSETIADLAYFKPTPTTCGMCLQAISASVDVKLSPDPYPGGVVCPWSGCSRLCPATALATSSAESWL